MSLIYIDSDEVIDQLDDDELIEEVRSRKLHVNLDQVEHFDRDYALRAYDELRSGRPSDALALLERALFPTIITESDYRKALSS